MSDLDEFTEWLIYYGSQQPRSFLYPTNDDLAWLIARHSDRLGSIFHLYEPNLSATVQLLNKEHLHRVSAECGLQSPKTFCPSNEREAVEAAAELGLPALLKPKTQMGFRSKSKGVVCRTSDDVKRAWNAFVQTRQYHRQISEYDPRMCLPMVQEFLANTAHDSFSIGGFVDHRTDFIVGLGSRKIFQRPRRLGVGIAFESEPIDRQRLDQLLQLAKRVSYSGIFEAEFLASNHKGIYLLADLNPRFYGQMAFEIARGLPLPLLAYAAATKNSDLDESAKSAAKTARPDQNASYVNSWAIHLLLRTQYLGQKLDKNEYASWLNWLNSPKGPRYDALADLDDLVPRQADMHRQIKQFLRHPRDFFRKFFLDT